MGFYYNEYVSVAQRKEKALKSIERLKKDYPNIEPVIIEGKVIAKSWWGQSWNKNLELYADYGNRIQRGRNYIKSNCVLDLQISEGLVTAIVQGSSSRPYNIEVKIKTLSKAQLKSINELCNNQISSLEALLEGRFPEDLEVIFKDSEYNLFPTLDEIEFDCDCPDYAVMCKHVAAVLYGVGARFDANPLLFFELRGIDTDKLVRKSLESKLSSILQNASRGSNREIDSSRVSDIFNI